MADLQGKPHLFSQYLLPLLGPLPTPISAKQTVGHLLLQFGSTLLFSMLTVLHISPCPAPCVLLWASRGNLVRNKPTGAKETSMSFCLALGQQAQMEMDLSPVVKTELLRPIHVNAASLQNPAETRGSLTFLSTLYCFPLTPRPPCQPIPQYTVMLSPKLYKTVHQGLQCLY